MADQVQCVPAHPPHAGPVVPKAPQPPQALQGPQVPKAPQGQPFVHLNCSNFKPEFSGKPDKDEKAHLLCTNDFLDTHHFIDESKIKDFL